MQTLTKSKLATLLNKEELFAPFSLAECNRIIDSLFDFYVDCVRAKHEIVLSHVGILRPVLKDARPGRNPKTGDEVTIPPRVTYTLTKNKSKGVAYIATERVNVSTAYNFIAEHCGLNIKEAKAVIELVTRKMSETVSGTTRMEIRGFGTFYSKLVKARTGRNPKTGDSVSIPEKRHCRFRLSRSLVVSK